MKDEKSSKNIYVKEKSGAVPSRVETVTDTYGKHKPYKLGTMPVGGFQSVWRFEDGGDCKNSGTSNPGGKKVY
jgi:hypothetical protein